MYVYIYMYIYHTQLHNLALLDFKYFTCLTKDI